MRHKVVITLTLLAMFLLTQFIGLAVINAYSPTVEQIINPETGETEEIIIERALPFGMQPPAEAEEDGLVSFIIAFVIAMALILILIKYQWKFVIRAWFFLVVTLAIGISINSVLMNRIAYASMAALVVALPLAFFKLTKPTFVIHNLTEFLIYPGIAAVFVGILGVWSVIVVLILISFYDMWAVWKSQLMQKMAKFEMDELKIFSGFLVPTVSKKVRGQINAVKAKFKSKKLSKKAKAKLKDKKFRVSFAILGGGDVVFPLIAAGVFLRAFGWTEALLVVAGALVGLGLLLSFSQKKKFYPAMPFISAGVFLGMIIGWLI
jgi:presenilin-like A22 family membrane protease